MKRYLALGDSYTIGEGVPEGNRFSDYLVNLPGAGFEKPEIIAVTGWTTSELKAGIEQAKPAGVYDLVSLLIGVNNQYRGLHPDDYEQEFADLLNQAIGFAGGNKEHVIVLSIPDWGTTPFAEGRNREQIAKEIDQFNAINKAICSNEGVFYCDITGLTRDEALKNLLVADNLHYSAEMYRLWAEKVYREYLA
ncbi:MAG: SGNH/GDSL hydrolase family protein [Bacteroidetes bacterium]|nr:SGNH/GDSL hydrolase family protein [Bacteroidota bacterium]